MEAVFEWYRYVDGVLLGKHRIEVVVFQVPDFKGKFLFWLGEEYIDCFSDMPTCMNALGRIDKLRCTIRVIAV